MNIKKKHLLAQLTAGLAELRVTYNSNHTLVVELNEYHNAVLTEMGCGGAYPYVDDMTRILNPTSLEPQKLLDTVLKLVEVSGVEFVSKQEYVLGINIYEEGNGWLSHFRATSFKEAKQHCKYLLKNYREELVGYTPLSKDQVKEFRDSNQDPLQYVDHGLELDIIVLVKGEKDFESTTYSRGNPIKSYEQYMVKGEG
ncbi:hypothetical protein GR11A_00096 [Vibrio phage vB_VcorM_GR11A]|nr:hypothetical protein GR11A_00096 [Vibrio phage vB_VcorM_GR11A]